MKIERPAPQTKRPADASLVFKGEIFDVYQWKQKLYDGSEAIFEALKRPDTVDVIPITAEGKIIVINEEQPAKPAFTSFPGGRVEADEDVAEAAARELLEETGYSAGSIDPWFAIQPVSKIDWAIYYLFARGCVKKNSQALDGGEKIEVQEIDFDTFLDWASQRKFGDEIMSRVLYAKLDPHKMTELKKIFSPQ